jgi:hypothetical protein
MDPIGNTVTLAYLLKLSDIGKNARRKTKSDTEG